MTSSDQGVPWKRILHWQLLSGALYSIRSISVDVWLASQKTEIDFQELKFGETNLHTIKEILNRVKLDANSVILDLGCGRGKAAFLFHFFTGAKVIALDLVGPFIVTARRMARWLNCETEVLFEYQNFLEADLPQADLIYACALCLGKESRQRLALQLSRSQPGTIIATVGWNPQRAWLEDLATFQGKFSWGRAPVYLKKIISHHQEHLPSEVD